MIGMQGKSSRYSHIPSGRHQRVTLSYRNLENSGTLALQGLGQIVGDRGSRGNTHTIASTWPYYIWGHSCIWALDWMTQTTQMPVQTWLCMSDQIWCDTSVTYLWWTWTVTVMSQIFSALLDASSTLCLSLPPWSGLFSYSFLSFPLSLAWLASSRPRP